MAHLRIDHRNDPVRRRAVRHRDGAVVGPRDILVGDGFQELHHLVERFGAPLGLLAVKLHAGLGILHQGLQQRRARRGVIPNDGGPFGRLVVGTL